MVCTVKTESGTAMLGMRLTVSTNPPVHLTSGAVALLSESICVIPQAHTKLGIRIHRCPD